jgi:RNA polymerase sigma-70 factor (ECF subfamily)
LKCGVPKNSDQEKRGKTMRCEAQLRDVARGDKQAFNAFYREWHRPMVCYATGLLAGDRSAAEDIVNEAFFAIWEQAASFNGSGSAEGWIRRIVRNKAVDWIRKQRDLPMSDAVSDKLTADSVGNSETPFDAAAKTSTERRLRLALAQLSVDHRNVVWLCYYEERGLSEIADIVQCPENTVKTRLYHARKILRDSGFLQPTMGANFG